MTNKFVETLRAVEQELQQSPINVSVQRHFNSLDITDAPTLRLEFHFINPEGYWQSNPIPRSDVDALGEFTELICSEHGYEEVELKSVGLYPNVLCFKNTHLIEAMRQH